MAGENGQANGEWDWLESSALRLVCALIFARGVTQDEVFDAFGLDPSAAQVEDWTDDPAHRRVRVGRLGGWAFAIDESMESLDLAIHGKNVAKRLSAGAEVPATATAASRTGSCGRCGRWEWSPRRTMRRRDPRTISSQPWTWRL
jgi:hypothetical protein